MLSQQRQRLAVALMAVAAQAVAASQAGGGHSAQLLGQDGPVPAAGSPTCDAPAGERARCYATHWNRPPIEVPSGKSTDGPLIGNGDLGVVATGSTGSIQMYTGKNDFWCDLGRRCRWCLTVVGRGGPKGETLL